MCQQVNTGKSPKVQQTTTKDHVQGVYSLVSNFAVSADISWRWVTGTVQSVAVPVYNKSGLALRYEPATIS